MEIHNLSKQIDQINRQASKGRLRTALHELEKLATTPELSGVVKNLSQTYGFVVDYALTGSADPSRAKMVADIVASVKEIGQRIMREALSVDKPSLYYSIVRYEKTQSPKTIEQLKDDYLRVANEYSMCVFTDPGLSSQTTKDKQRELESIERQWFRCVWTRFPLSSNDLNAIITIFDSDIVGSSMKILTIGALFIGNIEFFDRRRVEALLTAASNPNREISLRATVAISIALTLDNNPGAVAPLTPRFEALAENKQWRNDLKIVYSQLLATRDTDRITRKISDEILPSMKELGDDFKKMTRDIDPNDPEAIENSPEWMEMIQNSGLAEKMKEMNEIQEQGGDILMTTFGHLKNFAFFNEISNWFLPFDTSRSDIRPTMERFGQLGEMLASRGAAMMCDNDRYSIALAMASMPPSQSQLLKSQLEAQQQQMAEMQSAALNAEIDTTKEIVTNYVRSLYRFFKLFNRKDEFINPFDAPLNLLAVDSLRKSLNREELLAQAANFYFSHGYWTDALPLLKDMVNNRGGHEGETYFKIGCCLSSLRRHSEAIDYFEKSELFNPDNADLKLKLAVTNRELGNHKRAAEYFSQVSAERGGDDKIDLFTAASLVEIERFAEASNLLYKIDFNRGLSAPFIRRLARCEYMLGNFDKCLKQLNRLEHLNADDYLLFAAIEINRGNYRSAVEYLALLFRMVGADKGEEMVSKIRKTLSAVDTETLNIMIDEASSR